MSSSSRVVFSHIVDFIVNLDNYFNEVKTVFPPLKMYRTLLEDTNYNDKFFKRHVQLFTNFVLSNEQDIYSESMPLADPKLIFSEHIYIDIAELYENADIETQKIIWTYLHLFSKELNPNYTPPPLQEQSTNSINPMELFTSVFQKMQNEVDLSSFDNENPMQFVSQIMQSGVIENVMKDVKLDQLNLPQLLSSMGTLLQKVTPEAEKRVCIEDTD